MILKRSNFKQLKHFSIFYWPGFVDKLKTSFKRFYVTVIPREINFIDSRCCNRYEGMQFRHFAFILRVPTSKSHIPSIIRIRYCFIYKFSVYFKRICLYGNIRLTAFPLQAILFVPSRPQSEVSSRADCSGIYNTVKEGSSVNRHPRGPAAHVGTTI